MIKKTYLAIPIATDMPHPSLYFIYYDLLKIHLNSLLLLYFLNQVFEIRLIIMIKTMLFTENGF